MGLAGLGAGVRFVLAQGVKNMRKREETLTMFILEGLKAIPGITVYVSGDAGKQVAVVSFNIAGLTSSEVAMQLEEEYEIMCRPGLHCAPTAHKTLGTFPQGTVRLSPGNFNSNEDIEKALEAVSRIAAAKARC